MGRKPNKQVRLGTRENEIIKNLLSALRKYKIFDENRNQKEQRLNDKLRDFLRQDSPGIDCMSKNIPPAKFVGEQFRPDIFGKNESGKPLWCIECKKLTDKQAKSRWKEGLSQSLLYSAKYKVVVLMLYDFTKKGVYERAFGRGNTKETTLAKKLRDNMRIHIIVRKPKKG